MHAECTLDGEDALARSRLASRPSADEVDPASTRSVPCAREPRAELDRAPVVVGAAERHEHGAGAGGAVDEHRDVARRLVQQAQEPCVLEEPCGRVDEQQLGILLAGEPREVGAGRERGERGRSYRHAT